MGTGKTCPIPPRLILSFWLRNRLFVYFKNLNLWSITFWTDVFRIPEVFERTFLILALEKDVSTLSHEMISICVEGIRELEKRWARSELDVVLNLLLTLDSPTRNRHSGGTLITPSVPAPSNWNCRPYQQCALQSSRSCL